MKKFFLVICLVLGLVLAACSAALQDLPTDFGLQEAEATATLEPTATVAATKAPITGAEATETPESAEVVEPTATLAATATPEPATPIPAPSGECIVDSFSDHNLAAGETYDESPVGGLNESRWITWQGWTDGAKVYRYIFSVRPNTVVWIGGHTGGTGFYICVVDQAGAVEDLGKVAKELNERDGVNPNTITAVLPDDAEKLPILLRYQVKDQEEVQVRKNPFGPILVPATPKP